MARTLLCEIVTPESILYTNEVQVVVATTPQGEIGILPLHAPIVTTLAPGEVRLRFGEGAGDWEYFSVSGGYLQVHEDKVIVLANRAVSVSNIDVDRATEAIEVIKRQLEELLGELPVARPLLVAGGRSIVATEDHPGVRPVERPHVSARLELVDHPGHPLARPGLDIEIVKAIDEHFVCTGCNPDTHVTSCF